MTEVPPKIDTESSHFGSLLVRIAGLLIKIEKPLDKNVIYLFGLTATIFAADADICRTIIGSATTLLILNEA